MIPKNDYEKARRIGRVVFAFWGATAVWTLGLMVGNVFWSNLRIWIWLPGIPLIILSGIVYLLVSRNPNPAIVERKPE